MPRFCSPERVRGDSTRGEEDHDGPTYRPNSLPAPLHNDENSQEMLKAQIRQVQARTSLTPKDKAELVQGLMMKQWNDSRQKIIALKGSSDTETERLRASYHVRSMLPM